MFFSSQSCLPIFNDRNDDSKLTKKLFRFSLGLAIVTESVKIDAMMTNLKSPGRLFGFFVQLLIERNLKIDDELAFLADQVVVTLDLGLESVKGTAKIDFSNQALLMQHQEIAIDGAQAEPWKFGF